MKRDCTRLQGYLSRMGFCVGTLHGDMNQAARDASLRGFRDGSVPILLATDVVARGLDIPNVQRVVQYDLPHTIDDYVHRIGRTGRLGHEGLAIALFTPSDAPLAGELLRILQESGQVVPEWLHHYASQSMRRSGKRGSRPPTYPRNPHCGRHSTSYNKNHHSGNQASFHSPHKSFDSSSLSRSFFSTANPKRS